MCPIESAIQSFRLGVLRLFLRLGMVISFSLIPFYYLIGIKALSAGCVIYFALCILFWSLLNKQRFRFDSIARAFVFSTFSLILAGQYFNTVEFDSSPWLMLFPIVALPLGRTRRQGVIWAALAATTDAIIHILFNPHHASFATLLILLASFAATTSVVYYFIRFNENNIRQVAQLSSFDFLTQTLNRRLFNDMSHDEFNRSLRCGSTMTTYMCDIDYFKQYNDSYGHVPGDAILRQVAAVLKSTLKRGSDHLFRYGGEEFAILCSGLTREQAALLAENLRKSVESLDQPHKASLFRKVTISIGYRHADQLQGLTPEELVKDADAALYRAKADGRNRVVDYAAG